MVRHAFVLRALALLGAFTIAGTGVAAAANDPVRLGMTSASPANAVFAAAKALGLYSQAYLDVDIQSPRDAAAAQDALAAGSLDLIVVSPVDVSAAVSKGAKEKIVAFYAPPKLAGWDVMVPADSPLKTFADLKGKKLGVTAIGAPADRWVQSLAHAANVPVTSVALGGGVVAGLKAKQVDAAIVPPPASYANYLSGDFRALLDLETSLPPVISQGVAASGDMIDKRAVVLRRWIDATNKAVIYMQNHEEWTIAFLGSYLGSSDDAAMDMVYHDYIMKINPTGEMHPDWKRASLEFGALDPHQATLAVQLVYSDAFVPGERVRKARKGKK